MNLVLVHCWKEWRTQRTVLLAYALLVFGSLCLGFSLVPEHWWLEDGRRALALAWFVAAGGIGVIAFTAPALVLGEYGAKHDQFVRRLPDALAPSFGGKLLFLGLATLAFPLVGLLCGEWFLKAIGQPWHDLFLARYDGEVVFEWPWLLLLGGLAMLLVPWVWAIGMWLPGGRMAIGGTALFVLLLGLGVTAVLRQSPSLERGIAWQGWLWAIVPLGLVVAGISWVKGRRGGGALRSARFGLVAAAVGLLPPSLWFCNEAWHYHHPDLQHLAELSVHGISPDRRYVLAYGAAQESWSRVPLRIDLTTGAAEQLGGIQQWISPDLLRADSCRDSGALRYWRSEAQSDRGFHGVFDLTTNEVTPVAYDSATDSLHLSADLQGKVAEERFAATPFRTPGNRRVAVQAGELITEEPDGSRSRQPWPADRQGLLRAAGHGLWLTRQEHSYYDLGGREVEASRRGKWTRAYAVRDRWLFVPKPKSIGTWHQLEPDGQASPCEALHEAFVLGLFDDDHLLCGVTATKGRVPRLFLYEPASRSVTELALPADVAFQMVGPEGPWHTLGSLLPRDPAGRIWLSCSMTPAMRRLMPGKQEAVLLVDTVTRAVTVCGASTPGYAWRQWLAWPDAHTALVQKNAQILRLDVATGAETVLFPRHP